MFSLLNPTQIYGLQDTETKAVHDNSQIGPLHPTKSSSSNSPNINRKNNRQLNKIVLGNSNTNTNTNNSNNSSNKVRNTDGGTGGSGSGLAGGLVHHFQGMKVPVNLIEKLIKSEFLNSYDAVKHFKNFHHSNRTYDHQTLQQLGNTQKNTNCEHLHGNYRVSDFTEENISDRTKMTISEQPNPMQHQSHQKESHDTKRMAHDNSLTMAQDIHPRREEDATLQNTSDAISDESSTSKSNDPSSSSPVDSPETERKNSPVSVVIPNQIQRHKLFQMITFLDQQNLRLQKELAREKRRRNEELSRIIKSLLCMESKLKIDKKQINQRLLEKDNEICRLVSINRALRKTLNTGKGYSTSEKDSESECLALEALQCLNCKQDFYAIETKDNATQTVKDGRNSNEDPTTEQGSSSDDTVSSSFYGARRSVRYTSKRTFGTFRDYMRSRAMNIDDANVENSEENTSTISRDESHNSYEKMNLYSRAMETMHGVHRVSSNEGDLDSEYDNGSLRKNRGHTSGIEEDDIFSPTEEDHEFPGHDKIVVSSSKNNSLNKSKDFSEASPKQAFETSTDDWYASASEGDEEVETVPPKPYGYNTAVNPVLECVNQILLQQCMEESANESIATSSVANDSQNNSSSQRSGEPSRSNSSGSAKNQGNTGTISRKRVHFSTKNSMVHVPRDEEEHDHNIHHVPSPISSPSSSVIAGQIKDNILNYESIYSNEYEPICSENNSSNLYVDMEGKLTPEERRNLENKPPKQPPALPPKPANLIKFKKALKVPIVPLQSTKIENITDSDDKGTTIEPDYCSISEVNVSVTSMQVVADVHKEPEIDTLIETETDSLKSDKQSIKTDEIEEIFADIPRLPNVAAIIAPKIPPSIKISSITPERNTEVPKLQRSPRQFKRKHVPNILAEINKRLINTNSTTPTKNSNQSIPAGILTLSTPMKKTPTSIIKTQPTSSPIIEERPLPLQAEFDWYNLDVEYGKSSSNQPDIIRASDITSPEANEDDLLRLHGVEYNLDEEFSLTGGNQPDIIKENFSESPKAVIDTNSPKTVCKKFSPSPTPCLKKIKKIDNFDKFIDSSGLSTKPLPKQRKIYFSGPFV